MAGAQNNGQRNPFFGLERLNAPSNQISDDDFVAQGFQSRIQLRDSVVQPGRKIQPGVLNDQVHIFVRRDGERFGRGKAEDNVIALRAAVIKGRGEFIGTIWKYSFSEPKVMM